MSPSVVANEGEATANTPRLVIEFPPIATADDLAEISAITSLVNLVYVEAEAGIWNNGFLRTSDAEVANFIRKGQLALAYIASPPPPSEGKGALQKGQLVGCVYVKKISDSMCTLGMLALDKTYQGLGLGREIFKFVEVYCLSLGCDTLGLDILMPTTYAHPLKTRMQAWYERLGFKLVKLGDFAEEYPALAPLLSGPVVDRFFEKKLR
ncbi:acetyltransferase gnat family domain-containing [Trichoderma arundinaceum]|uniref:Acetyltransferase gnat family domain-containing n=1 Tax=Trichoderma arundinaceum TaxID=490622 RepID=A0A395NFX0_TRIAR|nr:acetyltransferase gnat family domain-containing [Trichoderma arundinaceum]